MKEQMKVLLVYSVSHALRIEKILKDRRIRCKLVPVPRNLSSDCGICLRFKEADEGTVENTLMEAGIETKGIFSVS